MATTHELKIWPGQFEHVVAGFKRHEVRVFDRDFAVGDLLWLKEWCSQRGYSGREAMARVLHITQPGTFGLPDNVGVMSIDVEFPRVDR